MIKIIKRYWEEKPLLLILIAGAFFRLIAVIFSKGFGMSDDHFLVIEPSQSWVDIKAYIDSVRTSIDGRDYLKWLPIAGNTELPGHSYLYPGLHYLLFLFLKQLHINDPQTKMYFVRFLHAVYSMSVIIFGYKITEKLSDKKNAALVGIFLALYWFMPFLSVRNLAEMVCIPLLLYGVYKIIDSSDYQINSLSDATLLNEKSDKSVNLFLAGISLGLALSIRYQTFIFIAGIFIVLLVQRKWKSIFIILTGFILITIIIEGVTDYLIWGYPFAEIREYIHYNINNAYNYITQPWYTYILFLLGFLIPPISVFLFIGFFKVWRKHLLIFLPTFLFLIFHSYFPNKQERFILPIIPFIIILGVIGWEEIMNYKLGIRNSKLIKFINGSWVFFWIINLILLPVISTVYSKKSRVESMVYLSKYQNINYLIQEGTTNVPPRYYLKQWANFTNITDSTSLANFKTQIETLHATSLQNIQNKLPKFVLFYDAKDLNKRVNTIKNILPGLTYETTIEPGFIDKILYDLNPNNRNQTIFIYKVN